MALSNHKQYERQMVMAEANDTPRDILALGAWLDTVFVTGEGCVSAVTRCQETRHQQRGPASSSLLLGDDGSSSSASTDYDRYDDDQSSFDFPYFRSAKVLSWDDETLETVEATRSTNSTSNSKKNGMNRSNRSKDHNNKNDGSRILMVDGIPKSRNDANGIGKDDSIPSKTMSKSRTVHREETSHQPRRRQGRPRHDRTPVVLTEDDEVRSHEVNADEEESSRDFTSMAFPSSSPKNDFDNWKSNNEDTHKASSEAAPMGGDVLFETNFNDLDFSSTTHCITNAKPGVVHNSPHVDILLPLSDLPRPRPRARGHPPSTSSLVASSNPAASSAATLGAMEVRAAKKGGPSGDIYSTSIIDYTKQLSTASDDDDDDDDDDLNRASTISTITEIEQEAARPNVATARVTTTDRNILQSVPLIKNDFTERSLETRTTLTDDVSVSIACDASLSSVSEFGGPSAPSLRPRLQHFAVLQEEFDDEDVDTGTINSSSNEQGCRNPLIQIDTEERISENDGRNPSHQSCGKEEVHVPTSIEGDEGEKVVEEQEDWTKPALGIPPFVEDAAIRILSYIKSKMEESSSSTVPTTDPASLQTGDVANQNSKSPLQREQASELSHISSMKEDSDDNNDDDVDTGIEIDAFAKDFFDKLEVKEMDETFLTTSSSDDERSTESARLQPDEDEKGTEDIKSRQTPAPSGKPKKQTKQKRFTARRLRKRFQQLFRSSSARRASPKNKAPSQGVMPLTGIVCNTEPADQSILGENSTTSTPTVSPSYSSSDYEISVDGGPPTRARAEAPCARSAISGVTVQHSNVTSTATILSQELLLSE